MILRVSPIAGAVAGLLLAAASAARADAELPVGKYTLTEGPELCFEPLADHRLRLTFHPPGDRMPTVLDGPYVLTRAQAPEYAATFTVESIKRKTLARCREYWVDEELPSTRQLDTELRVKQALRLTARYGCVKREKTVELCLESAGADGKQRVCRVLTDRGSSCGGAK